eukprot:TRINITY_DN2499_c0_g1_i2.p1 TRINITY_DN2499_c0_g1~~TRINITY_DN2499_c0_g1_i2.p1  ORF type:complete len:155 (-),score=16.85 TRINITY_DN2499_c0_g1_i2:32-496(-)
MAKKHRRQKVLKRSINKKRKESTKNRPDLKYSFKVQAIQDNWDPYKTLRENYKALGLQADASKIVMPRMDEEIPKVEPKGLIAEELKRIEELPPAEPYEVKSMSVREQSILIKLMNKYGEDYEAMSRDIKINVMQETARQLEKRIALLKRLQAL